MAAPETMREVTCVNWHSAADNYWKWDQEVPEHCYRKYPKSQKCRSCSLLKRSHNTFSSVVNCTLSELPDIDMDRTDVHRVGWNNELTYQTTVKWVIPTYLSRPWFFLLDSPPLNVVNKLVNLTKQMRMLTKLGFRSMSLFVRTMMDTILPESTNMILYIRGDLKSFPYCCIIIHIHFWVGFIRITKWKKFSVA